MPINIIGPFLQFWLILLRSKTLRDQEEELDDIILADSEAYVDMKHKFEESIATLSDQIQLLDAVHQMNEERLDYEIHVLR